MLDEETKFEFLELPLQDVVMYLKDRHHIEFQLDTKVMEEASIGVETPVTRNLQGLSLRSALRLMLGAMDLTYVVKDEVLLITTIKAANAEKVVIIYPVGDLIATDSASGGSVALIEIIKATVVPKTWQESGGSDSILPFALGEAPVIRQTPAVHEEVELLLTGWRRCTTLRRGITATKRLSVSDHQRTEPACDLRQSHRRVPEGFAELADSVRQESPFAPRVRRTGNRAFL